MKKLIIVGLIAATSGCATQSFVVNENRNAEPTKEVMQAFFVEGIGQEQEIDAADICGSPDLVSKVETHQSFLNGLLSFATAGVYTPRQATVYCIENG